MHETKELHNLKAIIRLGDYAGHLFNDLKRHGSLGCDLSKHADVISQALKDGDGTVRQALQSSVSSLSVLAGEMDFDTACFAIHAYAARNAACHSKAGLRKIARDWEGLAHQIDEDLSGLPGILPDGELQHLDNWTRIIQWFRDRSIEQEKDSGFWKEKSPDPTAADLARNPGPTLLDVRTLPLPVRPRAFHRGLFDGSPRPNGTTNAAKRKIEAKSDPTPVIPLKRKADGIPEGGGPRKLRCAVPESQMATAGKWDEFDRLSLDVSHSSRELADKDLGKSIQVLMRHRESIKTAMAEVEKVRSSKTGAQEKAERSAAKKARREGRRGKL